MVFDEVARFLEGAGARISEGVGRISDGPDVRT
jgi:hypothetical protein